MVLTGKINIRSPRRGTVMNKKRLWILGAPDPEMVAIETLLKEAGEEIRYATVGGKRVHSSNAYLMDCGSEMPDLREPITVVLVECDGAAIRQAEAEAQNCCLHVDHHRPGDPGYGKPPAEYWMASSIGQVYTILHPYPEPAYVSPLLVIAAADHCLAAAYRSECPGVEPDELMKWRVETRAKFQNRSTDDILVDVEAARKKLLGAPEIGLGIKDMTGPITPELPEAACREGAAYIAVVVEKSGRHKMVLGSASESQVVWFVQEYAQQIGLAEVYGDPARGFAGGYLPA